ncbi:MAG TPA: hypothetical protein VIM14_06180, partial [Polyangia bacterium]
MRTLGKIEVYGMSPKAGNLRSWLAISLPFTLALVLATPAQAQMGGMSPGMGPGMGRPGGAGPHEEKDEGPAEVAPDAEEKSPADKESDASYLEHARRRSKVVELDGYFRVRTDYLYKMNLDQGYNNTGQVPALPPFPTPSECMAGAINSGNSTIGCADKGMGDGNMRLRVEPTINISDQVRVRSQFDVFD